MKEYPKCGVVTFQTSRAWFIGDDGRRRLDYSISVLMHGHPVGYGSIYITPKETAQVGVARVTVTGCGVGTRLYEKMYKTACSNGARLVSDDGRTDFSEGFWKKQQRKGRAYCVNKNVRGRRLHYDGNMIQETGQTWSCGRWGMKRKCSRPVNLTGGRRRG